MMKRCAIYARVSTPEQRIDNQLYDLRKFAEQRGYEVACEYTDVGVSWQQGSASGLGCDASRFSEEDVQRGHRRSFR